MAAKGNIKLLSPILVYPSITQWDLILLLLPISALSPIIENGPIMLLSPIFAVLLIIAVLWILFVIIYASFLSIIIALKLASATFLPSTIALPLNIQTGPLFLITSICNSKTSPGVTGFLNFTLSIDMK